MTVSQEDIRAYLEEQEPEKLICLILERANRDPIFRREMKLLTLNCFAARAKGNKKSNDLRSSFLAAVTEVTNVSSFGEEWPDEDAAAALIEKLTQQIHDALDESTAPQIAEVAEIYLDQILNMIDQFHEGGLIADTLEKILDLHADACRLAKVDAETLASKIYQMELDSYLEEFSNLIFKYRAALGDTGMLAYRRSLESAWEKMPALAHKHSLEPSEPRYRLSAMMVNLCRLEGNLEAEAAVYAKTLQNEHDYLRLVQLYAQNRDLTLATNWAERGLKELPESQSQELRCFLADRYHKLGHLDESLSLLWSLFEADPTLAFFRKLQQVAKPTKEWDFWRGRAISFLKNSIQESRPRKSGSRARPTWLHQNRSSTLVEIHLWEDNQQEAWDLAWAEGVSEDLWRAMAKLREKTHPADAAKIYQKMVREGVSGGGNSAYRQGVKLLGKIQQLLKTAKQEDDFLRFLRETRTTFRLKRNFVKLLDTVFSAELGG